MHIKCVPTAEMNKGLMFHRLFGKFLISAHAEETTPPATEEGTPAPTLPFEQMIAQARKEEKDKLYPRLQKAEKQVTELTSSNNKLLLENAALKDELEKVKNKQGDSDEVKTLRERISTLESENKSLKENTPNEEDIRKKIEAEFEVKLYAQEQIAAHKGSILSILIPEITGKTREEIDSAIASAQEKTKSIKKDLGIEVDDEDGNKTPPKQKQKQKKAPVAAPPADEDGEEFDAEYIRNLDPRSPEYAEFRKKMGLR